MLVGELASVTRAERDQIGAEGSSLPSRWLGSFMAVYCGASCGRSARRAMHGRQLGGWGGPAAPRLRLDGLIRPNRRRVRLLAASGVEPSQTLLRTEAGEPPATRHKTMMRALLPLAQPLH